MAFMHSSLHLHIDAYLLYETEESSTLAQDLNDYSDKK